MDSFLFYLELIPLLSQFLPWHPEQPKNKFGPPLGTKKRALSDSFFILFCGERGIRTPGASQLNGFQDRRNRPLCHLSNALKTRVFSKSAAKVQQILDIRKFFCKKMVECLQFSVLLVLFGHLFDGRDIVVILRCNLLNIAFILRICYVYPT